MNRHQIIYSIFYISGLLLCYLGYTLLEGGTKIYFSYMIENSISLAAIAVYTVVTFGSIYYGIIFFLSAGDYLEKKLQNKENKLRAKGKL